VHDQILEDRYRELKEEYDRLKQEKKEALDNWLHCFYKWHAAGSQELNQARKDVFDKYDGVKLRMEEVRREIAGLVQKAAR
jgi:hypothetical protein